GKMGFTAGEGSVGVSNGRLRRQQRIYPKPCSIGVGQAAGMVNPHQQKSLIQVRRIRINSIRTATAVIDGPVLLDVRRDCSSFTDRKPLVATTSRSLIANLNIGCTN